VSLHELEFILESLAFTLFALQAFFDSSQSRVPLVIDECLMMSILGLLQRL